jgi:hypothetical protein
VTHTSRLLAALTLSVLVAAPALHAQWTAPTKEELAMTSITEVPGAPAVILYKEYTTQDNLHMQSFYFRVKVLTEEGKNYANVELPYVASVAGRSIDDISGRTIQPDGTIVPFAGKPYEKVVVKGEGYKYKVKVFSLPAVEVGSILEYRYKIHMDQYYFDSPDWIVQTELFTRKAHYMWKPTDRDLLIDGKQMSSRVAWTPILPAGVTIKQTQLPQASVNNVDGGHIQLDLDVQNIMPIPHEEFMPAMGSLSYKVLFYYSPYATAKEYWVSEGKHWSKERNNFIGNPSNLSAQVQSLFAPGDTQEQKLKKIYASVMTIENTDYTRQHSSSEERSDGLKDVKSAEDVLARKRGSGDQIAEVFVAMARAAGMKAYVMGVANRRERLFLPTYLSMGQIDDLIAIVNVDGKEIFFDPGSRYCSYGHLSWRHALTAGIRQTDNSIDIAPTPGSTYKDTHVSRVADLKLDDQGVATGIVTLSYTGDSALNWREDGLRGDETSLKHQLRTHLEHMLPGGMEVTVLKIDNLNDSELPLKVTYNIKGPIGSPTGKRLLINANLFEVNSKPRFPEAKRELPVDMHFPSQTQDAVRYMLPASMVVESAPTAGKEMITNTAVFDTSIKTAANSVTIYRNFTMGKTMLGSADYNDLRGFYTKVESKDQEPLVLTRSVEAKPASGGN